MLALPDSVQTDYASAIAGVGAWLWCLVIGALILVWILIGLTDLGRIKDVYKRQAWHLPHLARRIGT